MHFLKCNANLYLGKLSHALIYSASLFIHPFPL